MYLLLTLVSIIVIALAALGVALFLVHRRDGRGGPDERPRRPSRRPSEMRRRATETRRTASAGRRRLAAALAVAGLVAVGIIVVRGFTVSERPSEPSVDPQTVRRIAVGEGPTGATVIVRGPLAERRPVVIFLHGWKLVGRQAYRDWLDHLARRGNIVILPRYQSRQGQDPAEILGNAVAGIRSALRRLREPRGPVVAAGHSAGAALAADYAAIAKESGLPVPEAVFAVYPGRAIRADAAVPVFDPANIAASTRVVALAGSRDDVVGTAPAEQLLASATAVPPDRRRLVQITAPGAADHFAPVFDRPAVRRQIWARLDGLIDDVT